jgi:hypothetical protein
MKFANPFSSKRRTEKLDVPALTFLGEQDGPPERILKAKLAELFSARENVQRAYLARVHYEDPKSVSVSLCMGVKDAPDEALVEQVHSLFAQHFNRAVHLDILFLKPKQEEHLALVCKPFYQRQ